MIERRETPLILTIDRDERRNALDSVTSAALDAAMNDGERDADVAVIILTAIGERAFCSGVDMKEAATIGPRSGLIPGRGFGGITERRRTKPLIAAINGAAVAGGFEIALACDIVIAVDHAIFALAEVPRGIFAFAGGIQRLARMVPRQMRLQPRQHPMTRISALSAKTPCWTRSPGETSPDRRKLPCDRPEIRVGCHSSDLFRQRDSHFLCGPGSVL